MQEFVGVLSPRTNRVRAGGPDVRPEGDPHAFPHGELQRAFVLIPEGDDLAVGVVRHPEFRTLLDQALDDVPRRSRAGGPPPRRRGTTRARSCGTPPSTRP